MFLRNPVVYVQFHPVVYLVKLNIEMSMASLITHVARGRAENDMYPEDHFDSSSGGHEQESALRPAVRAAHRARRARQHLPALLFLEQQQERP